MNGWIKLDRSIADSSLWKDKPFDKARAWIDMILMANHKDSKMILRGEIILIPRGSFHTSINHLSERWGWNRKTTMKYLNMLESDEKITQTRTTSGTTINLVNYCTYQGSGDNGMDCGMDRGMDRSMDRGMDTIEEYKNKRKKEYIYTHTRTRNRFFPEEQQDYDFEALEKELLSNQEGI